MQTNQTASLTFVIAFLGQKKGWKKGGHKLTCKLISQAISFQKKKDLDQSIDTIRTAIKGLNKTTKGGFILNSTTFCKEKAQCLRKLSELLVQNIVAVPGEGTVEERNAKYKQQQDEYKIVLEHFRESVVLDPSSSGTSWNRFGDLLMTSWSSFGGELERNLEQACTAYAEAVSIEPLNSEYHYTLGMALKELAKCASMVDIDKKSTEGFNFTIHLIFGERIEWRERVLTKGNDKKRVKIMCAAATRYLRKACDELREATRLNPNNAMAISELAKIIFRFGGDTNEMVNKRRALGIAKMKHAIQIAIPIYHGDVIVEWKRVLAKMKTLPKHVATQSKRDSDGNKKKKKKRKGKGKGK